jgi:hypothetical protein
MATFYDRARLYLDEEDRNKEPKDLEPKAKARSDQILAEALHTAAPNPIEDNWFTFGFCTCFDERQEGKLGGLYQRLLFGDKLFDDIRKPNWYFGLKEDEPRTATFSEFWQAYESGTLIRLMDSKGLLADRSQFPYLEGFLSAPPSGPYLSVWSLK